MNVANFFVDNYLLFGTLRRQTTQPIEGGAFFSVKATGVKLASFEVKADSRDDPRPGVVLFKASFGRFDCLMALYPTCTH